jgi:hypothetical protein
VGLLEGDEAGGEVHEREVILGFLDRRISGARLRYIQE